MLIKTAMRYLLKAVRKDIINKSTNDKHWQGCGKKRTLVHCWWECRLVQSLWKRVWSFPPKLKMELRLTQQFRFWNISKETQTLI